MRSFDSIRALVMGLLILITVQGNIPVASYQGNIKTFTLSNSIEWDPFGAAYSSLEEALDEAQPGDQIMIVLDHNTGGAAITAKNLIEKMWASKALVTTKIDGYAHSAAMYIYLAGDRIIVPKHKYLGVDHLPFLPGHSRPGWYEAGWIEFLGYQKPYLTADEFTDVLDSEDVTLDGTTMCKVSPRLVSNDANGCVVHRV